MVEKAMEKRASFKAYDQHQISLLPVDLDTLIPENHMVRVVDRAIESMNTQPLFERYPGGRTSAYHPVMMLKVIVYAYADKIYSSRKIAKATRENTIPQWPLGHSTELCPPSNLFHWSNNKLAPLCGHGLFPAS